MLLARCLSGYKTRILILLAQYLEIVIFHLRTKHDKEAARCKKMLWAPLKNVVGEN
jgi:hypothetical protein